MKKFFIAAILLVVLNAWVTAEHVRLGVLGSVEFVDKNEEILSKFQDQTNIFPGFYWEVILRHLGFGMTYQAKFDKIASDLPVIDNEWLLSWIGSFDIRYHLFRRFFIDPFAEFNFGAAGSIELTDYENYGYDRNLEAEPFRLSLFAQIGCGAVLRLDALHLGGKIDYRFFNDIPPVTNFEPYPLKNFQFSLFGGFSI